MFAPTSLSSISESMNQNIQKMVSLRFYFRNGISVETGLYSFCLRLCFTGECNRAFLGERGTRTWADERGTIARMQTINEITVRLLPLSLFRTGGREGDGGGGLSDVSVRLEGRTDDRLVHVRVREDEEVSTQENQRKVGLNRLISNRKCIASTRPCRSQRSRSCTHSAYRAEISGP